MALIKQPRNSKLCGHCCIATVLGISLEEAITLIGHTKGTKTKELITHVSCTKRIGTPIYSTYAICILRLAYRKNGNWHWIVQFPGGLIYDPCLDGLRNRDEYLTEFGFKITSYLQLDGLSLYKTHPYVTSSISSFQ